MAPEDAGCSAMAGCPDMGDAVLSWLPASGAQQPPFRFVLMSFLLFVLLCLVAHSREPKADTIINKGHGRSRGELAR
jgi:hypothetical protein